MLAVAGCLLAAGGFALGHYPASRGEPEGSSPAPAASAGEAEVAIFEAVREPDAFARAARLATLLPSIGPAAVPAVEAALKDRSIDRGAIETELLLRYWATHDPAAAGVWATTDSPFAYRFGLILVAVELWAKVDPEAAAQQVRAMGPGRGPNIDAAEIALVRGWFDSRKPGLVDYIRDLGLTDEQLRALALLARRTIQRDGPEAAIRWAEALPDGDPRFKLGAFLQLAQELAYADPAAAVAFCDEHCQGAFGDGLREMVVTGWGGRDGAAAMQWLASLPAGTERDRSVDAAFRAWWRQDGKGLFEWMDAMGPAGIPPWLKPAAGLYAMGIHWERPLEAIQWAEQIEDEQKRELALITIARHWREKDESASEAWLAQSGLSEEARRQARIPRKGATTPDPTAQPAPAPPAGE